MAFNGTLFTANGYTVAGYNYVSEGSYKTTRIVQDVDSYRDAEGVLHRNALEHTPIKVEFQMREGITNEEWHSFWYGIFGGNPASNLERKVTFEVYVTELDDYTTIEAYVPDPEMTIKSIQGNIIKYSSIRVAFIGY